MIWTTFSMLLFLSVGVLASHTLGGVIHLMLALCAVVVSIKIIQDRYQRSDSLRGNSYR